MVWWTDRVAGLLRDGEEEELAPDAVDHGGCRVPGYRGDALQ
jgi:hypothetical protein